MRRRLGQKGFTLLEAMIVLAVVGVVGSLLSNLLYGAYKNWVKNRGQISSQRQVRAARDVINRFVRQARASTVVIDRYNSQQPHLSQITYVDAKGNSRAFLQKDQAFYAGSWTLDVDGNRVVTPRQALVGSYLQRATFFFPNVQDASNVDFVLYSVWPIPRSMGADLETQMVGSVEVRNP